MNDKTKIGEKFIELVDIMKKLRSENGCPWDKEQTPESILPFFLEEAYEVMESVHDKDWDNLQEEIGDILIACSISSKNGRGKKSIYDIEFIRNNYIKT